MLSTVLTPSHALCPIITIFDRQALSFSPFLTEQNMWERLSKWPQVKQVINQWWCWNSNLGCFVWIAWVLKSHKHVTPKRPEALRIDPISYGRQELSEMKALALDTSHYKTPPPGLSSSRCMSVHLCRVWRVFGAPPLHLWISPFCINPSTSWAALTLSRESNASCGKESAVLSQDSQHIT